MGAGRSRSNLTVRGVPLCIGQFHVNILGRLPDFSLTGWTVLPLSGLYPVRLCLFMISKMAEVEVKSVHAQGRIQDFATGGGGGLDVC